MNIKHIGKAALACVFSLALVAGLSGCGSSAEDKTIKVGASPSPHAEILGAAKDLLAEQGWTLEVVEYSDYIQPNAALTNGELDANYFQHLPYLENYNAENGTDLASAAEVHFEPLGLYAGKTASVDELADGAQIAVPSDTTNEARALLLLEAQGLITLKDGVGLEATANDIVENPKNIEVIEAEAAALPRMLEDVDMAVINGNYALSSGLDASLVVAQEDDASEASGVYPNVVAVRSDAVDSEKTKALVAALESDEVKQFIEETYGSAVIPLF